MSIEGKQDGRKDEERKEKSVKNIFFYEGMKKLIFLQL